MTQKKLATGRTDFRNTSPLIKLSTAVLVSGASIISKITVFVTKAGRTFARDDQAYIKHTQIKVECGLCGDLTGGAGMGMVLFILICGLEESSLVTYTLILN